MRQIITMKMLNHAVSRLNEVMETVQGKDEYWLSGAYGGWQLVRRQGIGMCSITTGFRPKRAVYDAVCAMVYGARTHQDRQREKEYALTTT
jgi:hypothetical protein